MDTNVINDIKTFHNNSQASESVGKELISQDRNTNSRHDRRTKLVFDTLRNKLDVKAPVEDKSSIEIQLEKSESHLENLIEFGNELINNIKSANEQHKLLQSQENNEKRIELEEKLHTEAELSLSQFNEISKKWMEMNNLKEPMAIHEDMQQQRENIANLMASKDELIEQCQMELSQINKKYYEDQNKQSEDICILVERIDHQIKLLKKSYRKSVCHLQNTIEMEKQNILQAAQEKWNNVYDHLTVSEAKKMELVKDKQKFYTEELENVRKKQEEITRLTKIRLEKDAEILELEIRKTQSNILMNSEKIDYNYQILQKRNEENIIINNQQKRRVAKLNESIVVVKKRLLELKKTNKQSMEKLATDIQKLHSNINDLQAKAECFRKHNTIKLNKVWDINFKEIKHLVTRTFEIDQILYEQQLGRKWIQPNFNLDNLDPQAYCNINRFISVQDKTAEHVSKPCLKQLHDILHKISDRAGFLVEDRLLQILKPYTDEEQCLVKIENIFSALNITNMIVVEKLIRYFEPYSWCPNCSSGNAVSSLEPLYSYKNEDDKIISDTINNPCTNHTPCIEPTLVLAALNEFIAKEINTFDKSAETRKSVKNMEVDLLQLDKVHVTSYWQQFSLYVSKEQQNIWKSIEHGLNHYLEVLKKRAQIDTECVFLQKQNAELKHLLQKL